MDEKRVVIISVGAVLAIMTITLLAVTMSNFPDDTGTTNKTNKTVPLLVISLDGFRPDYLDRFMPTLSTLAREGVTARYMLPSYPTLTFPNHYSIVTGLYPESHGIVSNSFYDPEYNNTFHMGLKESRWWGGEPIWNTLTKQNKISATFFWPGSDVDIEGLYPTHYYMFNEETPFTERVDKVVEWLSMPEDGGRPDWVSLYFEQPDKAGHSAGPDSSEVDNKLAEVDRMISRLLAGLRRNDMEDKVNIIILADHGMAPSSQNQVLNLTNYLPNIESKLDAIFNGSVPTLWLKDSSNEAIEEMVQQLSCPAGAPSMRAFTPQDLPVRHHYLNNKRIGHIVLDLDSGYVTYDENYETAPLGNHGYDNYLTSMGALFIATGPDFKKAMMIEPFKNIELYNLMCLLTHVDPAPNNGTEGALYATLVNPPPLPEVPLENDPPVGSFPPEVTNKSMVANCSADKVMVNNTIWVSELNETNYEPEHLPWGTPVIGNLSADILLLHHQDHITGYSQELKMPLWTSFTVTSLTSPGTPSTDWWSDVRLDATNTPTCESFDSLTLSGEFEMTSLFPHAFSQNSNSRVPFLVSNAIPVYSNSTTLDYIANVLIHSWKEQILPFNMIIGLVFDSNEDSLADDFKNITRPAIPSDIFVVVTKCRQPNIELLDCEKDLDVISFIFPEYWNVKTTCLTDEKYATFFLATLRDVELASGLTFHPELGPEDRLQLALKINTYL